MDHCKVQARGHTELNIATALGYKQPKHKEIGLVLRFFLTIKNTESGSSKDY